MQRNPYQPDHPASWLVNADEILAARFVAIALGLNHAFDYDPMNDWTWLRISNEVIVPSEGNSSIFVAREMHVFMTALGGAGDADKIYWERVQAGEESGRQDEACPRQEGADGQARCLHPTEG